MSESKGLNSFFFTDLLLSEEDAHYKIGGTGEFKPVPNNAQSDAVELFKLCSKNEAQDSRIAFGNVTYRCSKHHTVGGPVFALRRPMTELPKFTKLGYDRTLVNRLISKEPSPNGIQNGLVIFAGATGSGKTHSVCAYVAERLYEHGGLAVTLEDPPELPLQGVYGENGHGRCYQCDFIPEMGGVAAVSASILRFGSPNIVMYGEIRDGHSAAEAIRHGLSGHLVALTIHSLGLKEAIERLIGYAAEIIGSEAAALQLATALSCVIHQRLEGDGGEQLQLYADFLFTNDTVKAKIRSQELHTLEDDIDLQKNKMKHQPRAR